MEPCSFKLHQQSTMLDLMILFFLSPTINPHEWVWFSPCSWGGTVPHRHIPTSVSLRCCAAILRTDSWNCHRPNRRRRGRSQPVGWCRSICAYHLSKNKDPLNNSGEINQKCCLVVGLSKRDSMAIRKRWEWGSLSAHIKLWKARAQRALKEFEILVARDV